MEIPLDVLKHVIVLYLYDEDFGWTALYGVCRSWHSIYETLLSMEQDYYTGGNVRVFKHLLEQKKGTKDYPLQVTIPNTTILQQVGRTLQYPWLICKYGRIHLDIPNIDLQGVLYAYANVPTRLEKIPYPEDGEYADFICDNWIIHNVSSIKICKAFLRNYPLYSWQMKEAYPDEIDVSTKIGMMKQIPEFIDCLVVYYLYVDLMTELGYSQKEDFVDTRWILPSGSITDDEYQWLIDELISRDMLIEDFVEEFANVHRDPWIYIQEKRRLNKLTTRRTNTQLRQAFKVTTNNSEIQMLF